MFICRRHDRETRSSFDPGADGDPDAINFRPPGRVDLPRLTRERVERLGFAMGARPVAATHRLHRSRSKQGRHFAEISAATAPPPSRWRRTRPAPDLGLARPRLPTVSHHGEGWSARHTEAGSTSRVAGSTVGVICEIMREDGGRPARGSMQFAAAHGSRSAHPRFIATAQKDNNGSRGSRHTGFTSQSGASGRRSVRDKAKAGEQWVVPARSTRTNGAVDAQPVCSPTCSATSDARACCRACEAMIEAKRRMLVALHAASPDRCRRHSSAPGNRRPQRAAARRPPHGTAQDLAALGSHDMVLRPPPPFAVVCPLRPGDVEERPISVES